MGSKDIVHWVILHNTYAKNNGSGKAIGGGGERSLRQVYIHTLSFYTRHFYI